MGADRDRRREPEVTEDRAGRTLSAARRRLTGHPNVTLVLGLLMVAVLGFLDWASGPDLAFSIFYLLPVSAVAWTTPGIRTLCVAGAGALAWLAADVAAGQEYSNSLVPAWNVTTRFVVFVIVGALLSQLERSAERARYLASTDHLTGVHNVRSFTTSATATMARHPNWAFTLVYLDLDDFKSINDHAGHGGGDQALGHVGSALRAAVREDDVVGRLGGDEFAALIAFPADRDANEVAASFVARIQAALAGLDHRVTFSAGAVTFTSPPMTLDQAVDAADALMYEVKRAGKASFLHRDCTGDSVEGVHAQPAPEPHEAQRSHAGGASRPAIRSESTSPPRRWVSRLRRSGGDGT